MRARGFAVTIVALAGLAVAANAVAATRVVATDGLGTAANCSASVPAFSVIQDAVNASANGDTVKVCPGLYAAAVLVDKRLTILGRSTTVYATSCQSYNPNPAIDAIIEPDPLLPGQPQFTLAANGAALRGLVLRNNVSSPAVLTDPSFSGFVVDRDLITNNAIGALVDTPATGAFGSNITTSCFRSNNGPGSLVGLGFGVYSDDTAVNLGIQASTFAANNTAAVQIDGLTAAATVSVTGNKSYGDNLFESLRNSTTSSITGNIAQGGRAGGIVLDGNRGTQVVGNIFQNGSGDGILFTGFINSTISVRGNIVQHFGLNGIHAGPATLTNSQIQSNIVQQSGKDGVKLESGNTRNTLSGNIFKPNALHDCHDSSNGAGTAGTANTWDLTNIAATQNRNGLCPRAITVLNPQ